jgi:hypothetical protein
MLWTIEVGMAMYYGLAGRTWQMRAEHHFPYPLRGILGDVVAIVAVVDYHKMDVVE